MRPGDIAPDFEALDTEDRIIRLVPLLRQGPVVLYFFPRAFTTV